MAHSAGIKLELDDFMKIGKRVPVLADLKPSGRFLMSELIEIGGQTPLMKMLLEEKLLQGALAGGDGRRVGRGHRLGGDDLSATATDRSQRSRRGAVRRRS
jgi:dihydroxy-acid dehydratase